MAFTSENMELLKKLKQFEAESSMTQKNIDSLAKFCSTPENIKKLNQMSETAIKDYENLAKNGFSFDNGVSAQDPENIKKLNQMSELALKDFGNLRDIDFRRFPEMAIFPSDIKAMSEMYQVPGVDQGASKIFEPKSEPESQHALYNPSTFPDLM
jgi:hypothetical protein